MNTKDSPNLKGFLVANPMPSYSDCPWSDATITSTSLIRGTSINTFAKAGHTTVSTLSTAFLTTAGELNLMSRYSLNSSLTLNFNSANDSDATSSSTSSSSTTTNISSNSLSVSPSSADKVQHQVSSDSINNRAPTVYHQASNHLLELQKEIKEEEDEIFADINSLINGRSNLYSTIEDNDEEQHEHRVQLQAKLSEEGEKCSPNTYNNNNNNHHHLRHSNNNIHLYNYNNRTDEHLFTINSDDLNDYHSYSADEKTTANQDYKNNVCDVADGSGTSSEDHQDLHHFQSINDTATTNTTNANHQSTLELSQQDESQYLCEQIEKDINDSGANLETDYDHTNFDEQIFEHTCSQIDQQSYPDLQAVIQQVTSNLPKPCVFFLEGNCRRSDCKYSHDLSNITCKYWIEGFCFKGELCPFLHSYTPPTDLNDASLLDEDGIKLLNKKQLNPTFVIESEADFPSLPLDAPTTAVSEGTRSIINEDAIATSIKNQILSSNPAVVFKTVKKKRKRG